MDISIIIVNYKSKGLTLNCLKSIEEADFGDLHKEVIVVDNNSDETIGEIIAWQYPKTIFIQSEKNLGMGGGNNLGLRRASGDYLFIMNPDTMAFPDMFTELYRLMEEDKEIGLAGPKQFNPDQSVQDSAYRWHNLLTPFYRRTFLGKLPFGKKALDNFLTRDFKKDAVTEVDWLLGSCLCLRRKAWEEVGGFDERFFLYFEDTDLARRFWAKGWKVVYCPQAKVIHNHNRQSAAKPWYTSPFNSAGRKHILSWLKYLKKWGLKNPPNRR